MGAFLNTMDLRKSLLVGILCITVLGATAQPFCKLRRALYFVAVDGIEPVLKINGREYRPRLDKPFRVKGVKVVVMSPQKALLATPCWPCTAYGWSTGSQNKPCQGWKSGPT